MCVVEFFHIIQQQCVWMRVWIEQQALVQMCDAPMTHQMTTKFGIKKRLQKLVYMFDDKGEFSLNPIFYAIPLATIQWQTRFIFSIH